MVDDRMIFDELIAPMEAMMMHAIWRVVRNADMAESCLQDALAVIWNNRFQIRRTPDPRELILKICLNTAYDSLRKLERMRRQTNLSQPATASASPDHDADRHPEEIEIEVQVQQAIRRLPRKRALALMIRLIQEESFEAIVHALDCREATARLKFPWTAPGSGNGALRSKRATGMQLVIDKTNVAELDLENLLKRTLKDDLPPESEARMSRMLLSFRRAV